MSLSAHQKQILGKLLTGDTHPFPELFEAVSEQILLLIMKTRQLCLRKEYLLWFQEQHRMLTALQERSDKIAAFDADYYPFPPKESDALINALVFMRRIYEGYDKGDHSLQTWGEMAHPSANSRAGLVSQESDEEVFIRKTLFALLLEGDKECAAIPASERKGYAHQDLSLAFSCTDILLEKLNAWHAIDHVRVGSQTVYSLLHNFKNQSRELPVWLQPFAGVHVAQNINDMAYYQFDNEIYRYLKENMASFSETLLETIDIDDANALLNQFQWMYAHHACDWISNLMRYFRASYGTSYQWNFKTVRVVQEAEQIFDNDEFRCQITISRQRLLELIRKNGLFDATCVLAESLTHFYHDALSQQSDPTPFAVSAKEEEGNANFVAGNNRLIRQRAAHYLAQFQGWYQQNKTLFNNEGLKRNEKVNVGTWLAGVKCYDLKRGIPDGEKQKLKETIYATVRNDKSLHNTGGDSNNSLQRHHGKVKDAIKEIDQLLDKQKERNQRAPYNDASFAIKPLWSSAGTRTDTSADI